MRHHILGRAMSVTSDCYAVLDFETTGLNPNRGDRAIEIGISLVHNGVEVDTFSSLINPGMPINPFITALTGISNKMVASAPSAIDVMPKALEFVGDSHLVAHNASFDKKFWRHELKHMGGDTEGSNFLCTLMLSRRIFQAFASHKLGEIASQLGIEAKDSHRALGDAQVTSKILTIMLARLQQAYPGETINGKFLHAYQRKPRYNLPNLTTQLQGQEFGAISTRPSKSI